MYVQNIYILDICLCVKPQWLTRTYNWFGRGSSYPKQGKLLKEFGLVAVTPPPQTGNWFDAVAVTPTKPNAHGVRFDRSNPPLKPVTGLAQLQLPQTKLNTQFSSKGGNSRQTEPPFQKFDVAWVSPPSPN